MLLSERTGLAALSLVIRLRLCEPAERLVGTIRRFALGMLAPRPACALAKLIDVSV